MFANVPVSDSRQEALVVALIEYAQETSLDTMLGFVSNVHAALAHYGKIPPRQFDGDEVARAKQLNCVGRA